MWAEKYWAFVGMGVWNKPMILGLFETDEELFGRTRVEGLCGRGLWPPETAVCPTLPRNVCCCNRVHSRQTHAVTF